MPELLLHMAGDSEFEHLSDALDDPTDGRAQAPVD